MVMALVIVGWVAVLIAMAVALRWCRFRVHAACGRCRYNVEASVGTTDRCPECGLKFIEAGILPAGRARRGPFAVLVVLGFLVVAIPMLGVTAVMYERARRAEAMAAQQSFMALQLQAQTVKAMTAAQQQQSPPPAQDETAP